MDDRLARILFSHCPSVGSVRFGRLKEAFGSAAAALEAGPEAWRPLEGFSPASVDALALELDAARPRWEKEAAFLAKIGGRVLVPGDPDFPSTLKSLDGGPFALYIVGEWRPVDALAVAVVGSRRPTPYGRAAAERLAAELTEAGVTVVSGLARGIDTAAHEAVVRKKGRTLGILGGGFGRFYPAENRALADRMVERGGGMITEFPWSAAPVPSNFPRRNRIIAGMSLGVVVVEADVKSGALITAGLAAEQGREVFAVPGSIFSPLSRGPHKLLKEGAHPVEDAADVLNALEVFRDLIRRPVRRAPVLTGLAAPEGSVLEKISLDPVGTDDLARAAGIAPGVLSAALLNLELKGLVRALPGGLYVRTEAALAAKG